AQAAQEQVDVGGVHQRVGVQLRIGAGGVALRDVAVEADLQVREVAHVHVEVVIEVAQIGGREHGEGDGNRLRRVIRRGGGEGDRRAVITLSERGGVVNDGEGIDLATR